MRFLHLFLAKPAGPYYEGLDNHAWDIPKGAIEGKENLQKAAVREFAEEIGQKPKFKKLIKLGKIISQGEDYRKDIHIWAYEGNPKFVKSNTFEMEWPLGSGKIKTFPEIKTAQFFPEEIAKKKMFIKLLPFIKRLKNAL